MGSIYMGIGLLPLTLNATATSRHLVYSDGTICNVLSENLLTPTTKTSKTSNITNCPFEWKEILTTKGLTVMATVHQLFWTMGEPYKWRWSTRKSAGSQLETGRLHCMHNERDEECQIFLESFLTVYLARTKCERWKHETWYSIDPRPPWKVKYYIPHPERPLADSLGCCIRRF
jgi:hypothetical protein